MVNGLSARQLTCAVLVAAMPLSGCNIPEGDTGATVSAPGDSTSAGNSASERELRQRAAAMQRTIMEGIAAGAATGAAINTIIDDGPSNPQSFFNAVLTGAIVGGTAGTYVGHLQNRYATRESRLERLRDDLRANNAETQATLSVMRVVLANQTTELNRLRAAVSASGEQNAGLAREIREARANLDEMNRALEGAIARRAELTRGRNLAIAGVRDPASDAELAALSERIRQMRAVADSLESQL